MGKALCPDIFEDLIKNPKEWRMLENHINHLFDREEDVWRLQEMIIRIRAKSITGLTPPAKFCVIEI